MNPVALVSVIMPAYNAGNYLHDSIQSVQRQTYTNWELIIIDDGSTDNTKDLVSEYYLSDARIYYYYQANGKQGKARNNGISKSKGDLLAFLDADDWWVENKLATQVNMLLQQPQITLLFSDGYHSQNGHITPYQIQVKSTWDADDLSLFFFNNQIPIVSVLVKKSAILSIGGFSEEPEIQNVEDYDLWLKLLFADYKFQSIAHPCFYYRVHPHQSTFGEASLKEALLTLYSKYYNKYPSHKYTKNIIIKLIEYLKYDSYRKQSSIMIYKYFKDNIAIGRIAALIFRLMPNRYKYAYAKFMIGGK